MKTAVRPNNQSADAAVATYRELRPEYERLIEKLRLLLDDLLTRKGIRAHTIESRAKTIESFAEKIRRDGKNYKDPLREVSDLAGLRVILYYPDEVDQVADLVDCEFRVDTARSVDKRRSLRYDQFGYLSVHKIVQISESRKNLPEWQGVADLFAEIQIRSVLQHSWAAIQHALEYKNAADVPREFRRRLVRLAGLLELADEEFSSLRNQQSILVEEIAAGVAHGKLDFEISIESLREYVERSPSVATLVGVAKDAGFHVAEERADSRGLSQLAQVCRASKIATVADLDKALAAIPDRESKGFLREFFQRLRVGLGLPQVQGDAAHFVSVVLAACNDDISKTQEVARSVDWADRYANAIVRASRTLKKTAGGKLVAPVGRPRTATRR